VYTEHNRWPSHHPVTRIANRLTFRLADATVAVSDDVRRSMGRSGAAVEVIEHGVDADALRKYSKERDAVRADLGIRANTLLAVTVANLRVAKGYRTLLDAARLVAETGAPVQFVAAGQGPQEAELKARIVELGLGETFRLLGYVPDAPRLIAGADMFVLASDHEGLPLAVMEALALGVPIVATAVGGVPELVEDGTSGRLVARRDPAALAAAVLALTETSTRARLAAGAAARGESVDGRAAVARLDRLYAEIARDRR
jgi:glycosyltransferase involved in cell wall biosynthesis